MNHQPSRLPPLVHEPATKDKNNKNNEKHRDTMNKPSRQSSVDYQFNLSDDISKIDFVLVYDSSDENEVDNSDKRNDFINHLKNDHKMEVEEIPPGNNKKDSPKRFGYILIRSPIEVLEKVAEKIQLKLPIKKVTSEDKTESCWHRFIKSIRKPFRLPSNIINDDFDYYTAIYSAHNNEFKKFYEDHKNEFRRRSDESYFTPSERLLLTFELLLRNHDVSDDEDDDPIDSKNHEGIIHLKHKKVFTNYFPLHEPIGDDAKETEDEHLNDRELLKKYWLPMKYWLKFQPLDLLRSYLGEKIAFYFAFLGFYNAALVIPSLIGLIIFIYGAASSPLDDPSNEICGSYGNNTYMCPRCDKTCPFWKLSDSCVYTKLSQVFDNTATMIFAIIMSIWARWFVEIWKRRQSTLQYEWDSIDFDTNLELKRQEYEEKITQKFKDEKKWNAITEKWEPHIPASHRLPFYFLSIVCVSATIIFVCAIVFAIIVYRIQMDAILKKSSAKEYSAIIITITSGIMNLISIRILSLLYNKLAKWLTDFELHKHRSKHDDSLAFKFYIFEFFNNYASLFYIAFLKGRVDQYPSTYGTQGTSDFSEQCDPAGCFIELSIQLTIIFIGNQIINNTIEGISYLKPSCDCKFNSNEDNEKPWEKDRKLKSIGEISLINEYLEMVIQFGYVTLFAVAFPLAPLFALLNNIVEIRLDAYKFVHSYKRAIPFKTSGIGIWNQILSAISYIAVLTNAVIIAWTSEFVPEVTYRTLETGGSNLVGYVNWTLAYFPIADYNRTGTMPSNVPNGLTYCRYRSFRESTGPSYAHTSLYWHVIAARLAFIVVFEHAVYFTVYLIDTLVPDVTEKIRNGIAREHYIDQHSRLNNAKQSNSPRENPAKQKNDGEVSNTQHDAFEIKQAYSALRRSKRIKGKIWPKSQE